MIIKQLGTYNSLKNEKTKQQFIVETKCAYKETFESIWKYHDQIFNKTDFSNGAVKGWVKKIDASLFNNNE